MTGVDIGKSASGTSWLEYVGELRLKCVYRRRANKKSRPECVWRRLMSKKSKS
jgi:hypothetical protein